MIRAYYFFAAVALFAGAAPVRAFESDEERVVTDSTFALLSDARCAEVSGAHGTEITCFMSFPDTVPGFFYEADPAANKVVIRLLDTRIGDLVKRDTADSVRLGPIAAITVREEIVNKNETVKMLTPEWYYVTVVTLSCRPMIRRQDNLVVSEMDNAITISFPWPENARARKKYYVVAQRKRHPAIMFSVIGAAVAGAAAGGYYAYRHYYLPSRNETSDPLEPVLPEHPAP
jgi:hypothetical protein